MDRFWAKVEVARNGCWLWTKSCDTGGYGRFRVADKFKMAHRLAYELLIGPIPEGLELDHLCRTRTCVNPDHLEPVTHAENVRRGRAGINNLSKTHCKNNHALTSDNVYSKPGTTYRECRTCRKIKHKEEYVSRYVR